MLATRTAIHAAAAAKCEQSTRPADYTIWYIAGCSCSAAAKVVWSSKKRRAPSPWHRSVVKDDALAIRTFGAERLVSSLTFLGCK